MDALIDLSWRVNPATGIWPLQQSCLCGASVWSYGASATALTTLTNPSSSLSGLNSDGNVRYSWALGLGDS